VIRVCTSACQSSYGADFRELQGKTTISPNDRAYKKLQTKTNLSCVRNFLASIAHKVK
jgi:hypothetical protein